MGTIMPFQLNTSYIVKVVKKCVLFGSYNNFCLIFPHLFFMVGYMIPTAQIRHTIQILFCYREKKLSKIDRLFN